MPRLPMYEPGGGSELADQALAGIATMFGGYTPNFHKVLANSPPAVSAFEHMRRNLQRTRIRAAERELIAIEVSRRTDCHYCAAAHTKIGLNYKLSRADLDAAHQGKPVSNARQALVQRATQMLIDTHGHLSDAELERLRSDGLSDGELIEIIAVIGWYTWSTLVNNLARTDIDAFWDV